MPTRTISDTRDMTLEQADEAMRYLAQAAHRIAKRQAKAEAEADKVRERCEADTASDRAIVATYEAKLSAYVLSHPEEFRKPKMRKTIWGSFGLRAANWRLKIDKGAEPAIIDWLEEHGHDGAIQTVRSLIKATVKALLDQGEPVPRCRIEEGNRVNIKPAELTDEVQP